MGARAARANEHCHTSCTARVLERLFACLQAGRTALVPVRCLFSQAYVDLVRFARLFRCARFGVWARYTYLGDLYYAFGSTMETHGAAPAPAGPTRHALYVSACVRA